MKIKFTFLTRLTCLLFEFPGGVEHSGTFDLIMGKHITEETLMYAIHVEIYVQAASTESTC